jgi:hypothetical protein
MMSKHENSSSCNQIDSSGAIDGVTTLDAQIVTGELTLRRLSLERQLKEVRSERKAAHKQSRKLVTYYEERIAVANRRYQSTTNGSSNLNEYIYAAREQYDLYPGEYIVRKHAQLLIVGRSQQLLESYATLNSNTEPAFKIFEIHYSICSWH